MPNSRVEHCYTRVNCNDSRVIRTLHTHVFNSLHVLSIWVVYSQVVHTKCLHMRVPYTDMWVPYTPQWPHTLYLCKDITKKRSLQNITHLSVSNPSIDAIFLFETKISKFTHLTWCKNLYYHRRSFRVAAYNIWWVSTLWNYPSKALSTICRWHVRNIHVCIHSSSTSMCAALRVTHVYSKTRECSITHNGTYVWTLMFVKPVHVSVCEVAFQWYRI